MKKDQDFGFYGKGLDGYVHYRQGMEEAKRTAPGGNAGKSAPHTSPAYRRDSAAGSALGWSVFHPSPMIKITAGLSALFLMIYGMGCESYAVYGLYFISMLAFLFSLGAAVAVWHDMSAWERAQRRGGYLRQCRNTAIVMVVVILASMIVRFVTPWYEDLYGAAWLVILLAAGALVLCGIIAAVIACSSKTERELAAHKAQETERPDEEK